MSLLSIDAGETGASATQTTISAHSSLIHNGLKLETV